MQIETTPGVTITLTGEELKNFIREGYATHDMKQQPVTYSIYREVVDTLDIDPEDI